MNDLWPWPVMAQRTPVQLAVPDAPEGFGWVSSDLVELDSPVVDLPISGQTGSPPSPTPTPLFQPTTDEAIRLPTGDHDERNHAEQTKMKHRRRSAPPPPVSAASWWCRAALVGRFIYMTWPPVRSSP